MITKRRLLILGGLLLLIFILITSYCMQNLYKLQKKQSEVILYKLSISEIILDELGKLGANYRVRHNGNNQLVDTFIRNLNTRSESNIKDVWTGANNWVSKTQFYNYSDPNLGNVINGLKTAKIIKADVDPRGTQLKLLLTLEGGQEVVFKPKWYPKEKIIEGPVYTGKDRYGSEVVAFYLSSILDKRLIPVVTQRTISIKHDIVPVAGKKLKATIFQNENGQSCLYGKCFYCKKEDPICDSDQDSLTGAIIFNVKVKLQSHRSPWQRTYRQGRKAIWETNNNYCKALQGKLKHHTLLDLVEVSIFDFLIQNGDRHHYETLDNSVVLIDNGKGFGNPNMYYMDILAPLYQCCILRESTWKRLQAISGGFIKEKLKELPDIDNFLTVEHLNAIEQRLLIIYATVEYCRKKNSHEIFYKNK